LKGSCLYLSCNRRNAAGQSNVSAAALDDDELDTDANVMLEEVAERDVLYYRAFFADQPHDNYVAMDGDSPLVLTMAADGYLNQHNTHY
jgi:hypothetical protein